MSAAGEDQCGGGDDLDRLIKCAELANELAEKLEKLLAERGPEIRISGMRSRMTFFNLKEFLHIDVDFVPHGSQQVMWVPVGRARNWGYLSETARTASGRVRKVEVTILRRPRVGDLLMLYRMYEEGLLGEIAADVERAVVEMQRVEKMMKKASAIAEMIGIPQA